MPRVWRFNSLPKLVALRRVVNRRVISSGRKPQKGGEALNGLRADPGYAVEIGGGSKYRGVRSNGVGPGLAVLDETAGEGFADAGQLGQLKPFGRVGIEAFEGRGIAVWGEIDRFSGRQRYAQIEERDGEEKQQSLRPAEIVTECGHFNRVTIRWDHGTESRGAIAVGRKYTASSSVQRGPDSKGNVPK